jgi:lipoprotein-releasing system permease protein
MLIGIDDHTYATVSDFSKYLLHPENRQQLSFLLRDEGYDSPLDAGGWKHRRLRVGLERAYREQIEHIKEQQRAAYFEREQYEREQNERASFDQPTVDLPLADPTAPRTLPSDLGPAAPLLQTPDEDAPLRVTAVSNEEATKNSDLSPPAGDEPSSDSPATDDASSPHSSHPSHSSHQPESQEASKIPARNPFARGQTAAEENVFDEMKEQHTGIVLGIAISSVRQRNPEGKVQDYFLARPGDDVQITFPTAGQPPKPVSDKFTIIDLYESKMSEYDSTFAFVPLSKLQELRGMIDPLSGTASVTSIQMKLRPGAELNAARDKLRNRFPVEQFAYRIETWRDMQGPLLAAVKMETAILNILLFLIIAVAGFGILATFFMIVVEKTKDVGILKSLGAPSGGVMSIFLTYGLSLGIVGSGAGAVIGLIFVVNINHIAAGIEWLTGREVFDPTIYYFQKIPTIIDPFTVAWVSLGAVLIAVLASVLPAIRAARLHPVEALRYE